MRRSQTAERTKRTSPPSIAQTITGRQILGIFAIGGVFWFGSQALREHQEHTTQTTTHGNPYDLHCRQAVPDESLTLKGAALQDALGMHGTERQASEQRDIVDQLGGTAFDRTRLSWQITYKGPAQTSHDAHTIADLVEHGMRLNPDELDIVADGQDSKEQVTIDLTGTPVLDEEMGAVHAYNC